MKKSVHYQAIIAASVVVLALASFAFSSGKDKDGVITISGAISDSQCAFNVHSDSRSHDWMEKKGVYGAKDDKSCTLRCVKEMGGKYVLVTKKEVYHLDDQMRPEKFAGEKVKVTGTLDAKKQTMHVLTIEEDKEK
jgi:hypothetical protein